MANRTGGNWRKEQEMLGQIHTNFFELISIQTAVLQTVLLGSEQSLQSVAMSCI